MVWSTGIKQLPLTQSLGVPKHKSGRLMTDDWLRLLGSDRIFALGDCAAHRDRPLPALAQVCCDCSFALCLPIPLELTLRSVTGSSTTRRLLREAVQLWPAGATSSCDGR